MRSHCSDNSGACRYNCYGVQGYMKLGGHAPAPPPPQGKFEFLGETMLHLRPI